MYLFSKSDKDEINDALHDLDGLYVLVRHYTPYAWSTCYYCTSTELLHLRPHCVFDDFDFRPYKKDLLNSFHRDKYEILSPTLSKKYCLFKSPQKREIYNGVTLESVFALKYK